MGSTLQYALTRLRKGALLRLQDARQSCVVVFRGSVWITQDGDSRDAFLSGGDTFTLDRPGLALVEALEDTSLLVLAPESDEATVLAALPTSEAFRDRVARATD